MSTPLSENVVDLVSQLAETQENKKKLEDRVQLYEQKLDMVQEASVALSNKEQELIVMLATTGFSYKKLQSPLSQTPVSQGNNPEQVSSMLSNIFQQAPTSGVYNFPSVNSSTPPPPRVETVNRSIRAVPKTPPGLTVRRKR